MRYRTSGPTVIRLGLLAVLVATLLGAGFGLWWAFRTQSLDPALLQPTVKDIEAFAVRWKPWSALASIALMVLHSFLPLPAEAIAIANGIMFGPVWGIVITWSGAMIGAILAFALARWLGRPAMQHFVPDRWSRIIGTWRGRPSILLLVRLIPVTSFNLINYAAGFTGIGWWTFIWTTGLGILPIGIASVLLGDRLLEVPWPVWLLVGMALVLLWILGWLVRQRLLRAVAPGERESQ